MPTTSPEALAEAELRIAECRDTKASSLDLDGVGLHELPESIRELYWLEILDVCNNDLKHLPKWIGELTQLRVLRVLSNPLESLATSLPKLPQLRTLMLSGPGVLSAQEDLGYLTSLTKLAAIRMGWTQLPDWLRKLKRLADLSLNLNKLETLPEWIGELAELHELDLYGNHLRTIPRSLLELTSLRELNINGNPELNLPDGIVRSRSPRRILNYYFRSIDEPGTTQPPNRHIPPPEIHPLAHSGQSRASQPLNEFKLILVGRGGVGKTTLVHRLVNDGYKEFQRTPGVQITQWSMPVGADPVCAHVWDFGGQEIMHGTHRFFMTERALYLVLISGREGTEDRDAEYWLSMVRSCAGDAPVIVLQHKWGDFRFELNREGLREKYGQSLIFLETDSKTGDGIPRLREEIRQLATKLPGLRAAWPTEWRRVKDELPQQRKHWLAFNEFRAFCHERSVTDHETQEELAANLHDLGIMLSYRADETLRNFGVLNPQWVTSGIYDMLNAPALRDANGRFTVKTFSEVLPESAYPKQLHPYLLALMRKFRLCYPLDEAGENYLIPELLTKQEPKLDAEFPPDQCLGFIYRYDSVLPEGLLPRFIVETYVHHRQLKHVWRTGVVLERANCRAFVRGDLQDRTITIRVAGVGNGRRELLGIIREHFERIHRSYEKLPVTEWVPIPGHPKAQERHEKLLKLERLRRPTIQVEVGDEVLDLSVKELLDGIDLPGAPRAKTGDEAERLGHERFEGRESISVFISYARKDERFMDELRGALVPYERKGELRVWADALMEAGQSWEEEILSRIDQAQVIVLLLSNDFMRSFYCMEKELPRVMARREKGECEIVPVVVRAGRYDKHDLGKLQAIAPHGKPIDEHPKTDPAWLEVTRRLDPVIDKLKRR